MIMEKIYKIEQLDNGWVLRDEDAAAHQVCQEKDTDTKHEKFKNILGAWLYEDMNAFMDKELTNVVNIKITFEETLHHEREEVG